MQTLTNTTRYLRVLGRKAGITSIDATLTIGTERTRCMVDCLADYVMTNRQDFNTYRVDI